MREYSIFIDTTMKIKKIRLHNGYKRFHDLTIDLGDNPKRIVALVGPNGCGKSSVFDGMLYRFDKIGNNQERGYLYHSMNNDVNYSNDNVIIEFTEGAYLHVRNKKGQIRKEKTMFSLRSAYRFNSRLKITRSEVIPNIEGNYYGATYTNDIDEKMTDNYRRLIIVFEKYIKDNPDTATYNYTIRKIIGELNSAIKNCLELEISSIGDIASNKGTLYFRKKDQQTEFEFDVLSAGEKEVVDILLDLYLRKEEYNDTIFLFDEPELHINTSIQKKLLLEINKMVGENCQIWIATHSIGFLRALQEDLKDECQIIQFENGVDWASSTQVLRPIKKSIANWKSIFETALDDLSGLISPKRIIYCEGRAEPGSNGQERGLDAKVYNNIFSEKYHDTLFVSSGGNTELDKRSDIAISILSKVLNDIEILVLKDRDVSSGKNTSEQDRLTYLSNNPDYHRVLVRYEIENYLYDKEVLQAYCEHIKTKFDETEYDNFVTDIINQNLKDDTNRIKNICGITTSLNPEKFKENLSMFITEDMKVFEELEECIFNKL